MGLFLTTDYVQYLKIVIRENQSTRGYQSRLAEVIGTHGSYLSRVLGGTVHLSLDQAASLCQFWGLNNDETEYFLLLVNLARASTPTLKVFLKQQLNGLIAKREDLSKRLDHVKQIRPEETGFYYSSWHYAAIHMLLLIPKYQTINSLSKRLQLTPALVEIALTTLQSLKLVKKVGSTWQTIETDIHMSNQTLWAPIFHSNWRQRTAYHIFNQEKEEIHFSSLHAMSLDDFTIAKEILLQALDKIRNLAANSKEEEVFFFGVDFFKP